MKRQNIGVDWLMSAVVIVTAGLLLALLGLGGGGAAKAQTAGQQPSASWEYQLDSVDTVPESAGQLNSNGVAVNVQALGDSKYRLTMSGAQGVEQARQALYSPQIAGFIDGAAEIEINLPVSSLREITLRLESNLTTGYRWRLTPQTGFTQVGESTFSQSAGIGASSVQTLVARPNDLGNASIKLVYSRSFGPKETASRRLRVNLVAQAAGIDLSNPTRKQVNAQVGSDDSAAAQSPDADLALPAALPASFDWRPSGIVPAIRDQGSYGSCWAFGTVGVMESAIKKGGGPMTDLSEQFLVSCNTSGWGDGGLTAHRWHYNTLASHQTAIGAVLESAKPYVARKDTCTIAYSHPYKLSGWAFITGSEWTMPTVAQIKSAIYTYGPITAGVCADSGWDSYSGGVYNPASNQCGGSTNHQIILVGWDDATSSWILRNSWGSWWGENGYMRIKWDTTGTKSRVGEGTSWVRWANATTPAIKAPIGAIKDRTPTYAWTKISGATQYRYQVLRGATLVYTKTVTSAGCGATQCSNTPTTSLGYLTYNWRVQALVGGVWKSYSPYKTFSISP